MTDESHPLELAISRIGLTRLARELALTPPALRKWQRAGRMPRTEWTGETTYAKKIEALCEGLVTSERLLGPWPACAPAPAPSPPPEAGPVHGAATSGAPAAAAAGRRDRAFASFSEFQRREAAKSHAEDEGSLPPAPRVVTEGDRGPRETRRRLSRWEE